MEINEVLRLLRVFHDSTQKDLAEKLKISKSHLSEIESGKKTPTLVLLTSYSQVFKIPVWVMLFLAEEESVEQLKEVVPANVFSLISVVIAHHPKIVR